MSPSSWVRRFAGLIPAGAPVLDVACGGGRHLRHLHELGHPVTGIDRDVSGVADLVGTDRVEVVEADIEADINGIRPWPLDAKRRFGGVVVTNYLYRPIFPRLVEALATDGVIIYETFADGNAAFGQPRRPEFLLRPAELLTFASDGGLTVVAYEHGRLEAPRPAIVQRLCATPARSPSPLG